MPLPLTFSCFSKIQIGFTFLVLAHPGSPGKRAVKRVCMCVCVAVIYYILKLRTTYFTKYVYLLHSHEMWSVSCTFQIVDPSPAVESCSSEVTPSGTDHESVSSDHTKTDSLVVVSVTPERTSPSDDSSNAKGSSLCCYLLKLWARVWCLVFLTHSVDFTTIM